MKKFLSRIVPVLVLLVMLTACGKKQAEPAAARQQEEAMKVYWNVERVTYEHDWFAECRRPSTDGCYRIRFAVDGQQVDLLTERADVAAEIDNKFFMGLVFDEQGMIVDVVDVEEFTGGTAYVDYYVESFTDTELTVNCTANLRGPRVTYKLDENTEIYNSTGTGILVGTPGQLSVGAKISAVLRDRQTLSHIYVEDPFQASPVYWNVTRMYDSTNKITTRSSDEVGNYVYEFAVNGELVQLKTRDFQVATRIDSFATRCLHLEFDEEGYISKAYNGTTATGGGSTASWYHVIGLEEDTFTAKRFDGADAGKTVTGRIAKDVKVFDVSGKGAYIGEPTELRLYDRVHCLKNPSGDVAVVMVVSRFMDGDMYWNLEQMYNKSTKHTTRTPDTEGWYYLKMAANGGNQVLKTKDVDIVNSIDSRAARCCVLQVEGDVITAFGTPANHFCGVGFCSWADVTAYENGVVTALKAETGVISTGTLAADCKIYNVSDSAVVPGEETELQVGDRIHALKNLNDEVGFIFIVSRPVYTDVYYNVSRKWDSTNKITTRTPAEDGWYYIDMAVNGGMITVKTPHYDVATSLDSALTHGLVLGKDNVVLKRYSSSSISGYTGGSILSGYTITEINGKYVTGQRSGKSQSAYMAWNCKVYNLSNKATMGAYTSLRVGDTIHSLKNARGELTAIWVLTRPVISDIYWNTSRQYDSVNGVTKRAPDAEGFYHFTFAVNGTQKNLKTNDITIASAVDAVGTRTMGLELEGDVITAVYANNKVQGYEGGSTAAWYTVNSINGNTLEVEKKIESDSDYGTKLTITIPDGTPIYNCSTVYSEFMGEASRVRVGDTVYCLRNKAKDIVHVLIVDRLMDYPLYWNVTRMYDTDQLVTTRTPDASGWYTIEMVGPDGLVTLKTQKESIATAVDRRAAFVMALQLDGDVIKNVYGTGSVYAGAGGSVFDWDYRVTAISETGAATIVRNDDVRVIQLDSETVICDVSKAETFGTIVPLQVGDVLRGVFFNASGNVGAIFVYKHTDSKHLYCDACGKNVFFEAWDGTASLSDGHYYLKNDVTVTAKKTISKGKEVTLNLNGHTINGGTSLNRIFDIEGTFNLTDPKVNGEFKGYVIANVEDKLAPVFYVREGATFNLYGGNLTCTKVSSEAGVGTIYKSTMNMYDGRLYGGSVNQKGGGNLAIFSSGTFNMYGGIIEGGKSTVTGGNVYSNSTAATFRMLGGTITGGEAVHGSGVSLIGKAILGGSATISGNIGDDLYLEKNQKITIESPLTENAIGISIAAGTGVFTEAVAEGAETWFKPLEGYTVLRNENGELELQTA